MPQNDLRKTYKSNQFRHENVVPNELMTVEFRGNDPTDLTDNPMRMWARTDTGDLKYTVDGVNVVSLMNQSETLNVDVLRVHGSSIATSLAPFGVLSTELEHISGAVIQKAVTNVSSGVEVLRLETYNVNSPSTVNRLRMNFRLDTQEISIDTTGSGVRFNGFFMNVGRTGTTAQRPISGLYQGMPYYDTTLGIPIYYNGGSIWRKYSDNSTA